MWDVHMKPPASGLRGDATIEHTLSNSKADLHGECQNQSQPFSFKHKGEEKKYGVCGKSPALQNRGALF